MSYPHPLLSKIDNSYASDGVWRRCLFLLGLIAGKINLFGRIPVFKSRLLRTAVLLLPIGLGSKIISCIDVLPVHLLPSNQQATERLLLSISGFIVTPLQAMVYLSCLAVFLHHRSSHFWQWIANTGRIGLTNYLLQTLLCMVLFYGYAGGLGGHITLIQFFVPVVVIYTLQVLLSNLWLKHYAIGPMEKLWRKLAYGNGKQRTATPVYLPI